MHRGLCYVESKFKKHLFLPFYFLESVWGKTCETSVISKHTDEIIILQLTVH